MIIQKCHSERSEESECIKWMTQILLFAQDDTLWLYYNNPLADKKRSASIAALHPLPAAVIA